MRALQHTDRCDRCMAQAYLLAHKSGSELLFCGHHGRENFDSLTEQGWYIDDQTRLMDSGGDRVDTPMPGVLD